jgi:leucyl-tRNA synthetase
VEDPAPGSATAAPSADKSKAKKGKLQAKATGHTYQFQILESIGVPRERVKDFADPMHWLTYFPPIAEVSTSIIVSPNVRLLMDHFQADQHSMGTRIDWRRSFLTTPANPYFDSFVKWQMRKLKDAGKIKFGKRYTIYCIKDGQPCMDHDRSDGEGIGPQEYTGIKMEVIEWSPAAQQAIADKVGGRKVYLVAATLRPETMYVLIYDFIPIILANLTAFRYGQTNCFVGPSLKYGVYAINDKEAYVCTLRAARNMAYQDIITPTGNIEELASVEGSAIVGTKIKAPFSVYPEVYVLPMETVLATKV